MTNVVLPDHSSIDIMEIIKTNRGGQKLCYQGHMYVKKKSQKSSVVWECSKRKSIGCSGSLKSDLAVSEILQVKPHSHGGDQATVDAEKARQIIRQKCLGSRDTPGQIFATTMMDLEERAKEVMSSEVNCKQVIRYHRKKRLPF